MSNSTPSGASSNSSIFSDNLSRTSFDGAAVTAFWQSNAARWMRSSQILMRGMTEIARLEGELGRNLLQVAVASMKAPSFGSKPEERRREQLGIAAKEFSGLVTSLRKICDESRNVCNDATLALFESAESAVPHSAMSPSMGKLAPSPATMARAAE